MVKEDSVWALMNEEARNLVDAEPDMMSFVQRSILDHSCFDSALSYNLANQLNEQHLSFPSYSSIIQDAMRADPSIGVSMRLDIIACFERDAACDKYLIPLLFFKGFQALQLQRIAHWYWTNNRKALAYFLQSKMAENFDVDIHPGAQIGSGIMIDHAVGLVVGETTVIGNNVSILHSVTLGGSGSVTAKRCPKVCDGVMISTGAKIIGDITIGEGAKIGAGSLVLHSVAPHVTVAGVPGVVVGAPLEEMPALGMNQNLDN